MKKIYNSTNFYIMKYRKISSTMTILFFRTCIESLFLPPYCRLDIPPYLGFLCSIGLLTLRQECQVDIQKVTEHITPIYIRSLPNIIWWFRKFSQRVDNVIVRRKKWQKKKIWSNTAENKFFLILCKSGWRI